MVFVFLIAPLYHSGLSHTKWADGNPNEFGSLVDVSYGVLGGVMAAVKDAMDSESP